MGVDDILNTVEPEFCVFCKGALDRLHIDREPVCIACVIEGRKKMGYSLEDENFPPGSYQNIFMPSLAFPFLFAHLRITPHSKEVQEYNNKLRQRWNVK